MIKQRGFHPKTPGIQHSGELGLYDAYHCYDCGETKVKFRDGDVYKWEEGEKYTNHPLRDSTSQKSAKSQV